MNRRFRRLTMLILPLILGPLLAWSVLSAMAGNQSVPLKGTFSGAGDNFSGKMTHLGRFDGGFDQTTQTAVWVAANGDTINNKTTEFTILDCQNDGWCEYEQSLEITGGTGRFAYAGGSATAKGFINLSTGAYDGRLKGTLTIKEPEDAGLAARISAPSHPVDVDDDGVKELFEYDVAVLADDDEIREAFGGLQIRDGNKLNSIAILDGGSGCDYDFNRPVLEMVGTSTTSQHGNRGEVELFEAAVRVSPVSVGSGVNNALAWTLHFTETLPPPPTATTVMAVVGDDVNLSYTHTFTEPIPPPNNGFISSDLCPVIPGPD